MERRTTLSPEEMVAFSPAEKIGLIAFIDPDGLPHISLITSIMAAGKTQLTLGEFCKGRSKQYIQQNPDVAFLVMTLDKKMWRGTARWTHMKKEGPEYEMYNNIPMFRYNTYFGINTVHYLDVIEISGPTALPMSGIIRAALLTRLAKGGARTKTSGRVLNPFAENLFNDLGSLKFISYMGEKGFPVIVPIIQCQAADSSRLVFSTGVYRKELQAIPRGIKVAVFCLTMGMESVLIRGKYTGMERCRLSKLGAIDIDWVYNSMPPCHGQIYPEVPLEAVVNF